MPKHVSKKQRKATAQARTASRKVAVEMLNAPSVHSSKQMKVPEKLDDWLQAEQDKIDDENEFDSIAESIHANKLRQEAEIKQGRPYLKVVLGKKHMFVSPKKLLSPIQEGGKSIRHKSIRHKNKSIRHKNKSIRHKSIKNKSKKYRK
jgi:hypothetical protein